MSFPFQSKTELIFKIYCIGALDSGEDIGSPSDMMYDSDEPRGRKRKPGGDDGDDDMEYDDDEVHAELREMAEMKRRGRRPNERGE